MISVFVSAPGSATSGVAAWENPWPYVAIWLFSAAYLCFDWTMNITHSLHAPFRVFWAEDDLSPPKIFTLNIVFALLFGAVVWAISGSTLAMQYFLERDPWISFVINSIAYPAARCLLRFMLVHSVSKMFANNLTDFEFQVSMLCRMNAMLHIIFSMPGMTAISLSKTWESYLASMLCNMLCEWVCDHAFLHIVFLRHKMLHKMHQRDKTNEGKEMQASSELKVLDDVGDGVGGKCSTGGAVGGGVCVPGTGTVTKPGDDEGVTRRMRPKNERGSFIASKEDAELSRTLRHEEFRLSAGDQGEKVVALLAPFIGGVAVRVACAFEAKHYPHHLIINSVSSWGELVLRAALNVVFEVLTDVWKSSVFSRCYGVNPGAVRRRLVWIDVALMAFISGASTAIYCMGATLSVMGEFRESMNATGLNATGNGTWLNGTLAARGG